MRALLILSMLFLLSCAKSKDDEVIDAIDYAQTLLTKNECDEAIDLLEDVGRQADNPVYLQVLSSAYACRAGYSEITFLTSDIEKIETTEEDFMPSLTKLSLSQETEADSDSYNDLKTAISILVESAENQSARNTLFGSRKAADIGIQALFMCINQLGKFLYYYGNVDSTGAKGQGSNSNQCFITYDYNQAQLYLNGTSNGGACNNIATDTGHPELSLAAQSLSRTRRRLCEGLLLVTNVLDIVNNVDLSSNDSVEKLQDVLATINDYKDFVVNTDSDLATLLEITSQGECEELVEDTDQLDNLQFVYALLFERGLP